MSRILLQKWGKVRTETEYTVTLDGVPLGCDVSAEACALAEKRLAQELLKIGEG